jgi:hypothetical protein
MAERPPAARRGRIRSAGASGDEDGLEKGAVETAPPAPPGLPHEVEQAADADRVGANGCPWCPFSYSHSIVAGGLLVMS